MDILKTVNLCRSFKIGTETVHALRNVSLNISKGQLTILMGRSGSGKTTLVNLLGALDRPNLGSIFLNGCDITKLSDSKRDELRRKRIGLVFQSVALVSMLTAYENVDFCVRVSGVGLGSKARKDRVLECLKYVGLEKRLNHKVHELSGGEQQRVAIARAIAHKPEIIIADEPTASLDTLNGLKVIRLFKSLIEHEGISVIMTTHDPGMIEVADCLFVLEDGEVVNERK
jgi:putative ABC transport system ATP-binding protein